MVDATNVATFLFRFSIQDIFGVKVLILNQGHIGNPHFQISLV